MVLMIDNYDSFTYNLVQYFMQLGEEVRVFRNDAITGAEAEKTDFDYLVISPGPGGPEDAGVSGELIRAFAGRKPILGVCLGHQTIAHTFGGRIVRAKRVMHGKSDMVHHDGRSLFAGLPDPVRVIRYHSLAVAADSLPEGFEVSGTSSDGEIMAIRHKEFRIEGVQFHPESIGSEDGMKILANFLSGVREVPPLRALLTRIASGGTLTEEEASHLMLQITEGNVSPVQTGAFLTALAMRPPEIAEVTGLARVLQAKAVRVPVPGGLRLTDTCGTGGDATGTFNISTAAAFVACGAGVVVAKHGNRSITSRSGSADVLEALGVPIDLKPEEAAAAITTCGISFLFAPNYHPAFKNIMGPRRELGFRTVFNMMGPLLNPARVQSQVMGVYNPELTEPVARILGNLGIRRALVVHGHGGMDEISLTGPSRVTELDEGWVRTWTLDPAEYGFEYCLLNDLKGGDARENARIIRRILTGEPGPGRDVVILNAAAAILAAGLAGEYRAALALARASIDSGSALARLESLAAFDRTKAAG